MTIKKIMLEHLEQMKNVGQLHIDLFTELAANYASVKDHASAATSICNYLVTSYKAGKDTFADHNTCLTSYNKGEILAYGASKTAAVNYSPSCGDTCNTALDYYSMILAYNNGDKCAYQILNFNPASTDWFVESSTRLLESFSEEQLNALNNGAKPALTSEQLEIQNSIKLFGEQVTQIPPHTSAIGDTFPAFTNEQFKDGSWINHCGEDLSKDFPLANINAEFMFYHE